MLTWNEKFNWVLSSKGWSLQVWVAIETFCILIGICFSCYTREDRIPLVGSRPDTSQRQQRWLPPLPPLSLPWCPCNNPVEAYNLLQGDPLPRGKYLGAFALSKMKHKAWGSLWWYTGNCTLHIKPHRWIRNPFFAIIIVFTQCGINEATCPSAQEVTHLLSW